MNSFRLDPRSAARDLTWRKRGSGRSIVVRIQSYSHIVRRAQIVCCYQLSPRQGVPVSHGRTSKQPFGPLAAHSGPEPFHLDGYFFTDAPSFSRL